MTSSSNRKDRRAPGGWTVVEAAVASFLTALLFLAAIHFVRLVGGGLTSTEAQVSLNAAGQNAVNQIGRALTQGQLLFDRSAGSLFISQFQFTGPPPIAGALLPLIQDNGTLSVSSPSFASVMAPSVGNSLLFANAESPVDFNEIDGGGTARRVRIDVYRLRYYFLSAGTGAPIAGRQKIVLREWISQPFASYASLTALSNFDATLLSNTTKDLVGNAQRPITAAWDPAAGGPTTAFYALDSSGYMTLRQSFLLVPDRDGPLVNLATGVLGGSFRYGVCPNLSAGTATKYPVPVFSAPSPGMFPAGFEILTIGPNTARQVFIRLVLAAEGSFQGLLTTEHTVLTTLRETI